MSKPQDGVDIGIITVLAEETAAVLAFLSGLGDYRVSRPDTGLRFHEATVPAPHRPRRTVLVQATSPGAVSAATLAGTLRSRYEPQFVIVVGIAGGVHPSVRLGDVVIADGVICYDHRRETDSGAVRHGQMYSVPAAVRQALNAFFTRAAADPGYLDGFQVWRGPIGSGDAAVASSAVRTYLLAANDKTLAVEMAAAGVAHEFAERPAQGGWLTVRGISDVADNAKNDAYRIRASANAATVLWKLIPLL